MSAFDRLPKRYRSICEQIGYRAGVSPQNRRVRFAADRAVAAEGSPNGGSRQQDRARAKPWKKQGRSA